MTDAIAAIDARLDALKRKCVTGYGCGSTCINVKKECRSNPAAATSRERLQRLGQLAKGEIKPRGIGVPKAEEARAMAAELQGQRQEQQAVIKAERKRRQEEAKASGRKPSVKVNLRRAKPGGEFGPDGHWYPGGAWMSEGGFVGAKAEPVGDGQQGGGADESQKGGDRPQRVVQPKRKPRRVRPLEPRSEGLPRPTGLKKIAVQNDQEWFNDRGYLIYPRPQGSQYQSLGGSRFEAAVIQRMSTEELQWATSQILRIAKRSPDDHAEMLLRVKDVDGEIKRMGGLKAWADNDRWSAERQLIGVDDERLRAGRIFMDLSGFLGSTSPAARRLRQKLRQPGEEHEALPEFPGEEGARAWALNNVFRAVARRRQGQGATESRKNEKQASPAKPPPIEARRSRPKERISFEQPIVGPTGAKLTGYTWQWSLEEVPDKEGELVEKRVSNWEESITNVETGRNVVHQFEIQVGGDTRVVSAESALKLLGFTDADDKKRFGSLKSTARTVARLRMGLQQLDQVEKSWQTDWEAVEATPRPQISSGDWEQRDGYRVRKWRMGDASVDQIHNSLGVWSEQEVVSNLVAEWKGRQMEQRGWDWTGRQERSMRSKLNRERDDLNKRLARAQKKLQAAQDSTGRPDSLTSRLDTLAARLDALKRKCNTGYSCGSSCISVKKECRSNPQSSVSKERAERLAQLVQGEIRPRGIGGLKPEQASQLALEIRKFQRTGIKPPWYIDGPAKVAAGSDELDVSTPEARMAFVKHMRERSISRPGASYTGNTLATATLALCDEPGEVGRNARRMAKFLATSNVLTVVDQIKPDSQPQHRGPAREADVKHLMSKDAIAKVRDNEPKMAILVDVISYNKQDIAQSKKTKADLKKGLEELERTTGWDTAYDIQRTRERIKEQDDAIKIAKQTLETSYRTLGIMLMGTPDAAGMAARNGILKMRDDPGWDTPWSAEGLDPTQLQSATQVQVSTYGDIGAKSGYTTGGAPGLGRNQQVMSTFIHEVGHMVQFASGDARNTIPKLPPNLEAAISSDGPGALGGGSLVGDNRFFVSDYSTTNRLEFFAESFVAFVVAPQQLRQRSQEVYDWVDDTLRRANANPVVKPTVAS